MEIVKNNFEVTCGSCKSVLKPSVNDIHEDRYPCGSWIIYQRYIICPCCGKTIDIK